MGDNDLRVQACENCHGPDGTGQPPFGPYLAGLHARYLEAEMQAFRSGTRRTDPSGQMEIIARQLTEVLVPSREQAITEGKVDEAAEILIRRQDTHLDSLIVRLQEPRVRAVMELTGSQTGLIVNLDLNGMAVSLRR